MPNVSKPTVLVADDEPSMVAMLSSHLRSKGYGVLEASDGDQAWELAHEHLPNLVVLDVMMPGMSGWEVCRKIREAVSLAHTGVIMLTGIGENLNEMTSPLYGADAYLDKPFEFSDLDEKIDETIARREQGALGRADNERDGKLRKTSRTSNGRKPTKSKAELAGKPALAKAVARPPNKAQPPAPEAPLAAQKAKGKVKVEPKKPAPKSKPAAKAAAAPARKASKNLPSKTAAAGGTARKPPPSQTKPEIKSSPNRASGKAGAAPSKVVVKPANKSAKSVKKPVKKR